MGDSGELLTSADFNSTLDRFCLEYLWTADLLSSTSPQPSQCLQHTLLVWLPCLFLFVWSPYVLYRARRTNKPPLPFTLLLCAKLLVNALLVVYALALLVYNIFFDNPESGTRAPVWAVYPAVLLLAMVVALILLLVCRQTGVLTSGVLFLSWLFLAIFGVPELRHWIQEGDHDTFRRIGYFIYYALILLSLFVSSWADRPDRLGEITKENTPPELRSSFLNQLTFWWLTPLAVTGNRRPLERKDLWTLNERDKSETVVRDWNGHWGKAMRDYATRKEAQEQAARRSVTAEFGTAEEEVKIVEGSTATAAGSKPQKPVAEPSIMWRLFLCNRAIICWAVFLKLTNDLLQFCSPQVMKLIIGFIQDPEMPQWRGIVYAFMLFAIALTQSMILHQYFHRMFTAGMNIKSVLMAAVFEKSLRLSNSARKNRTVGEIVNLMSVDVQRFQDITAYMMLFWSCPLQIILAIYFLFNILGYAVFGGLVVMVLMIPVNFFISVVMRKLQTAQMKHKDDRIKLMNEILNGMRVLKLYAWEPSMEKMVLDIRTKEITVLKRIAYLNAAMTLSWTCTPFLVAVLSFATYVLTDPENNVLTPQVTFVSLALFNILRFPMSMLANLVGSMVQCLVSNKRLKSFLSADELDPFIVDRSPPAAGQQQVVSIHGGTFTWEHLAAAGAAAPTLKNIDLRVERGALLAVVGKVGCGKSSLLAAMLGEMEKLDGDVGVHGEVCYVPQQAWIQNVTLRENVLFGLDLDMAKYDRVVDACALRPDFDVLPAGDDTEIGEKGINLSGGQKSRVSLARAVYQGRDIYLLDDPLSAVDSHVGKHIFDQVLGPEGLLKDKTRILVTHGLGYLKHVDRIVVMRDGTISEMGTYEELLSHKGAFAEFLEEYLLKEAAHVAEGDGDDVIIDDEELAQLNEALGDLSKVDPEASRRLETQLSRISQTASADSPAALSRQLSSDSTQRSPTRLPSFHRQASTPSRVAPVRQMSRQTSEAKSPEAKALLAEPAVDKSKLVKEETSETGKVKLAVYMTYLNAIGYALCVIFICVYLFSSILGVSSNIWLADWSDDATRLLKNESMRIDTGWRLAVYAVLGLGQAFIVCLASVLLAVGMVFASRRLHAGLLHNLLRSPMSFYDVTPIGRILNRFGKDVEVMDSVVPITFRMWIYCIIGALQALIVIIFATPAIVLAFLPIAVVYFAALDTEAIDSVLPAVSVALFVCLAEAIRSLILVTFAIPLALLMIIIAAIIYAFHADIDVMDFKLPEMWKMLISCIGALLATFFVIILNTPIFLVSLPFLSIIYVLVLRFYVSTSRQLKRLESVSRSPIYSHFQEVVQGAVSIRAYDAQQRFIQESGRRVDSNLVCYYPSICANRWLAVRLEFVGNCIVLFAALFSVLFRHTDGVTAGLVGLSLTYALNITQTLNWAVRMTSDLETNIVAVERIQEYTETPQEANWASEPGSEPPKTWPAEGRVAFGNYSTRYREGMELVLNNIRADVGAQEKIGIVGRTGAGKSSLTLALFRIIEPASGTILIDGRDICRMGLHDVRSKLTIIPQDPVLFSSTLRMNLDPFEKYSDADIWTALEHSHLKDFVNGLADKLQHPISEGGENLSVGQRQLMCLARALLRKTRILVLDEATAAVDMETDSLIQKTIRQEFVDCTILTIAHRLNTILDNDRVMVLEQGRIKEFAKPQELLSDKNSTFYSMAKDAGIVN